MNKLKDILLFAVAIGLTICLTVSLRTISGANTYPANTTNIVIDLPSDFPGDKREDGWHYYIYEGTRGCLCYKDSCLIGPEINDYYVTPWGKCFWHGEPAGWRFNAAKGPLGTELHYKELQ